MSTVYALTQIPDSLEQGLYATVDEEGGPGEKAHAGEGSARGRQGTREDGAGIREEGRPYDRQRTFERSREERARARAWARREQTSAVHHGWRRRDG